MSSVPPRPIYSSVARTSWEGGLGEIHAYSMILTYGGDIHIGANFSMNPFAIVYGHGGARIRSGVRIATHTVIIPANHDISAKRAPLFESGVNARGIEIDNYAWLDAGVVVLDGVQIGHNSVVGAGNAGTAVTKSVPESTTVAGVPARVIAER